MPPTIISLINLKGGVGKTTTTIQLAECLASVFDKTVLVVDLDPQTNTTISLISEEKWLSLNKSGRTLYHLFNDRLRGSETFEMERAIQRGVSNLSLPSLHLLSSSIDLIRIQDGLKDIYDTTDGAMLPQEVLHKALLPFYERYDYILIDCPPNLGYITRNGIEISDYYLIPCIPDTLSTYGLSQVIWQIQKYKVARNLRIRCMGLVMTKVYSSSTSHKKGMLSLPYRFADIFSQLNLEPAPIFKTHMPLANSFADLATPVNNPRTFKQKYGYNTSGGQQLHAYVTELTEEFIKHAR
ncbi:p-loop containing nucleoside triphosphate hydrolase [Planctomycetales bacterium 10988]|nr:p-loop containing nucleoside triphosphate hydrolase [Planctomycetales bacterium 10988]